MAKYDWKQSEKEYILSDYKSVSSFLKNKEIKNNSYARNNTKGWKEKKRQNTDKKVTKTIEKVTEKEAEKEAQKIVNVKDVANELLQKIVQASSELDRHSVKNKKRARIIEYDTNTKKPKKEVVKEEEEIASAGDIVDRKGLKELASALKDLNDIINNKKEVELSGTLNNPFKNLSTEELRKILDE